MSGQHPGPVVILRRAVHRSVVVGRAEDRAGIPQVVQDLFGPDGAGQLVVALAAGRGAQQVLQQHALALAEVADMHARPGRGSGGKVCSTWCGPGGPGRDTRCRYAGPRRGCPERLARPTPSADCCARRVGRRRRSTARSGSTPSRSDHYHSWSGLLPGSPSATPTFHHAILPPRQEWDGVIDGGYRVRTAPSVRHRGPRRGAVTLSLPPRPATPVVHGRCRVMLVPRFNRT